MTYSIYQAAVPSVVTSLECLSAILDKAVAHCAVRKIDPAVLVNFRLAPDMFPLSRQVQIATDQAKGMAARLAGVEVPSYPDTETTFEELKARIAKTIAFVQSFKPEQFNGAEDKDVSLPLRDRTAKFKGGTYLTGFVLPNLYFHAAATYLILRHCGVELGKRDFLAPF